MSDFNVLALKMQTRWFRWFRFEKRTLISNRLGETEGFLDDWDKSQILFVIGAKGFLGSAIMSGFRYNYWRVVACNSRIQENLLDLKEELKILQAQYPMAHITIINCAWSPKPTGQSRIDSSNLYWVQITNALVTFCVENSISFYGIGTCLEKNPNIQDPYTSAKRQCRKIVIFALRKNRKFPPKNRNNVRIGWLIPHYLYSKNKFAPGIVRSVADQISMQNKEPKVVTIDTNEYHDFIEVMACVKLVEKAIIGKLSGVFDLGTGKLESNKKLIERLFPGASVRVTGNISKLKGYSFPANMKWIKLNSE